jgi:cyclin-dependent kinase 7
MSSNTNTSTTTTTTTKRIKIHGTERYEKSNKLGEGTFAEVYLAYDIQQDRQKVAVKRIKKSTKFVDGVSWTALREIKFLREINHENIVNLLDVFTNPSGQVHLVFEYCSFDLDKVIRNKSRPLRENEIATYMWMLLNGLDKLHSYWILHRDLKPENLLIDPNGILKIGDFGLARTFAGLADCDRVSDMTSQVVTRGYKAPEIMFGAKDYGEGVDMWSVGCIFAELMTGVGFFGCTADSDLEELGRIFTTLGTPTDEDWPGLSHLPNFMVFAKSTTPPVPLSEYFSHFSPLAVDLISKLFIFDPVRRIRACDALKHPYFVGDEAPIRVKSEDLPKPIIMMGGKGN